MTTKKTVACLNRKGQSIPLKSRPDGYLFVDPEICSEFDLTVRGELPSDPAAAPLLSRRIDQILT